MDGGQVTRFGELAKAVDTDRKVLDLYDEYVSSDRDMAKEAEVITWLLTKNGGRDRQGTWSASSAGRCLREQQFTYLGVDGLNPDAQAQTIFANGDYMHLRYQVAGIVGGWLTDAEVPLHLGGNVRGTADGILAWGEVLELKSINFRGFAEVVDMGPKSEHKWQATAYMLATGLPITRFVYENKNTQANMEFEFALTDEWATQVTKDWERLDVLTANQELAPMRKDCEKREGFHFKYCPFAKICHTATFPRKRFVLDADS